MKIQFEKISLKTFQADCTIYIAPQNNTLADVSLDKTDTEHVTTFSPFIDLNYTKDKTRSSCYFPSSPSQPNSLAFFFHKNSASEKLESSADKGNKMDWLEFSEDFRKFLNLIWKEHFKKIKIVYLNRQTPIHCLRFICGAIESKLNSYEKNQHVNLKKKTQRNTPLKIQISHPEFTEEFGAECLAYAQATLLAKNLAMTPSNYLNPDQYGKTIRDLCRTEGLKVKFHSLSQLKKLGAGAFLAVAQAYQHQGSGVYEITYQPKASKNKKPVSLVGKGLCFDTGGYNVKTGNYMMTMKGDMQGSAVALATLLAARKMKWPLYMKAWLAITENHISPIGFKPDDIVTALNKMSIEIVNTDAEGRMVLADTLTLATQEAPIACIDFATLTGTAVRAIGNRACALFSNRDDWNTSIESAVKSSGERMWRFPLYSDYEKQLESKVADLLQCVAEGNPDHILAALFLKRFLENDCPWIHIDMAAAEVNDGYGAFDGPFTGVGAQWALDFIRHQFLKS